MTSLQEVKMMEMLQQLKTQFGDSVSLEQVKTNVFRVYAPFFHEDGDMLSIYLEKDNQSDQVRIRDFGNALRRVSYTFDMNTEKKQNILNYIVKSNDGFLSDGEVLYNATVDNIGQAIMQYSQIIAKVSNIEILRREVIRSLFYEYLGEFVSNQLGAYNPQKDHIPIAARTDLKVDWLLQHQEKKLYLFGVKDNYKANEVTVCCLEFQRAKLPYSSLIVYEDFDNLGKKEKTRLTNAGDKQFTTLDSFKEDGSEYIHRCLAS